MFDELLKYYGDLVAAEKREAAVATLDTVIELVESRIKRYDRMPRGDTPSEVVADFVVATARKVELETLRDDLVSIRDTVAAKLAREES